MQNGARPVPEPSSLSGLKEALSDAASVDFVALQSLIDRLVDEAVAESQSRHEQALSDLERQHQEKLDAALTDAAKQHQIEMREAQEAFHQHLQAVYEDIRLSRQRLFGRSSESHPGQLALQFDEAEAVAQGSTEADDQGEIAAEEQASSESDAEASAVSRKVVRPRGKRSPIPAHAPRFDVVIDLPEADRVCPCCNEPMVEIGQETSEQIDVIPMKFRALRFVRKRYGCPSREHPPKIAARPEQVLPKSNASNNFLAMLLTMKYVDGLPLARMEYILGRMGIRVPRVTLARWVIQSAEQLKPLAEAIGEVLYQSSVQQIDETTVQVLKEKGRDPSSKSYMWVQRGGPPERPVIKYTYNPSRSGQVALDLLKDWKGYLMTDGYSGYNAAGRQDGIELLACWAHVRRGFVDVIKLQPKGLRGRADEAVDMIAELYAIEKEYRHATVVDRKLARQEKSKLILDRICEWLDQHQPITPPKSALGQAMNYMANQWPRLVRFIDRGDLPIDNNLTENAIRPFVTGRKAWLFSDTPAGADASALIYSLIETAKANGLEPYTWLTKVMKELPKARKEKQWEHLLPWNCKAEDLITEAYSSEVPT